MEASLRAREPLACTAEGYAAARARLREQGVDTLRKMLEELGVVHAASRRLNPLHNIFSRLTSRELVLDNAAGANEQLGFGQIVAAFNRPDADLHWESDTLEWVGRASMSRRHRFLLLDDPRWVSFNALTFGMDEAQPDGGLAETLEVLERMRTSALALAAHEGGWGEVGMFFHVFPHNSIHALHMHVLDLGATGPTYAALQPKNMPLSEIMRALRSELVAMTLPAEISTPVSTALAFALGGGSDAIGALALARALGHQQIILVNPASGSMTKEAIRGAQPGSLIRCAAVAPAADGSPPPVSGFHNDSSMLAYLLRLDVCLAPSFA
jgi:hypothetical protein